MTHYSPASNTKPPSTRDRSELALCVAIQQYADEIVDQELETARTRWAAHWECSEEVEAVLEEMAHVIARDVVTARVRLAARDELDAGRLDHSGRARCDQLATLFALAAVDTGEPADDY